MQAHDTIDFRKQALFLDFDGTLVDFADDPMAVAIRPATFASLRILQDRLDGALAIVSGRRIADLDHFLAPWTFSAAGVHGLELRQAPGSQVRRVARPEDLEPVRIALAAGVATEGRLRLEDKGTALVLHYRGAPELAGFASRLMEDAVAGLDGLKVMAGNNIVEVHPAGMDKGEALAALMASAPFAGRVPIYAGDDTTDEFAFRALARWNGIGIKVGEGQTAATRRLRDVAAVEQWLNEEAARQA